MRNCVKLELANINEAQRINDLLNLAYRGNKGWTTEVSLVNGDRSNISDVKLSIENSIFLVYKNNADLVACICLEPKGNEIYIGSFAVHPDHQAQGLGKLILRAAEAYAINELNPTKFVMVVLSSRTELIAFYERRGYQRTGLNKGYPLHLNVGTPKINGLTIEQLCKDA
jgi:ribosomal protein S18 acetylase RimI-like enzyme